MPQDQMLTAWPTGRPGMARDMQPKCDVQMINYNPATAEVRTLTVDTATDSTVYTWTLMGVEQTITSATSETVTTIATKIKNEILADPFTSGYVEIEQAAGVLTLTYREPGVAFTLSDSDARLTCALDTTQDAADEILFGAAVMHDADDVSDFSRGRVTALGGLTAMAYDLTPQAVNDAEYMVFVEWNEQVYAGYILADSSATVDEIVDAMVTELNGVLPANSVLAAADTTTATKLILTSEIAGMPFRCWATCSTAAKEWTVARSDSGGAFADLNKVFAGVALEDVRVGASIGDTHQSYPGQYAMTVRKSGGVDVIVQDDQPDVGEEVWIGVGSGHEGFFRTTLSGANYVKLDGYEWRGHAGTYNSQYLGVIAKKAA